MTTPFLQELITLLGDTEGQRIYRGVVAEYANHFKEHLTALKTEKPTDDYTAIDDVVARVDTGLSLHLTLEPPEVP